MGKRRKNPSPSLQQQRPPDEFSDEESSAKQVIRVDTVSQPNGGGMSRAAKKRARKRAKVTKVHGANDDNDDGEAVQHQGAIKKMELPLETSEEEDELKGSEKVKKSKKNTKGNDDKKRAKKASSPVAGRAKDTPNENQEGFNAIDEMEPELEELLSTLTPLQVLLLDEKNQGDDKPPAELIDQDLMSDGDYVMNPLDIIGDLTTQHRARVLLSSIIHPSAVTVSEFYDEYWGKRPLIAAFDESSDENQNEDSASSQQKQRYREHVSRLDGFLNRTLIHDMICKNKLRYGLDLNVTRYTDSMGNGMRHRITLDPPPKKLNKGKKNNKASSEGAEDDQDVEYVVANPSDVWSNVDASHCTVRLLRPHEHSENIHAMLSLLESEFGCMVGSNAYLTPLNSQGFAPHYDDVDVFILQLEGFKRWRVYPPINKKETLPRASSRDYTEKEVEEMGEEEVDMVLGPGDVLYLPRGWIHQAETVTRPGHLPKVTGVKDDHSLHLTVSAMQNWSWADFLEMLIPEALEGAAASDKSTSLREGLPVNFLSYMGTMHSLQEEDESDLPEGLRQAVESHKENGTGHSKSEEEGDSDAGSSGQDEEAEILAKQARIRALQNGFKEEAKKRIMRVCKQAMSMLDDACDQIGIRFLSDRLPPALLKPEAGLTKEAHASSSTLAHHHDASKKIWPNTLCRLVRPNIARLVIEDSKAVLYHCLDNSLVYHKTPLSPMEFEVDDAPALEQLLTTVEPNWIMVKDLLHGDIEDKMEIAQALYDEGILATKLLEIPDRSIQTG
ncbi:hypothetical protein HJC23_004687 [Cyclotella cryptica]|uniref:Bifunctional lysine-specific demethylase and histidyl-hydroxylase n=1 Tax=Cyclotella cryptica TaxID=29204 RepID=A0ABD3PPP1_9STRA|eukprot:CCRYP_013908-RA/>CCRYP_013908-RA protein AED:0.08 eAED:0.08 QI:0/-1/0/1/-1/1/1/0/783